MDFEDLIEWKNFEWNFPFRIYSMHTFNFSGWASIEQFDFICVRWNPLCDYSKTVLYQMTNVQNDPNNLFSPKRTSENWTSFQLAWNRVKSHDLDIVQKSQNLLIQILIQISIFISCNFSFRWFAKHSSKNKTFRSKNDWVSEWLIDEQKLDLFGWNKLKKILCADWYLEW